MKLEIGQKVAALVRFSLSDEKWVEALYDGEAVIGKHYDGTLLNGHRVITSDGLLRYSIKCLPIEKAEDCLDKS